MTFTNKKSLIALILTLCMIVSLFTVAVSATSETTNEGTVKAVTGESNSASADEDKSEANTTDKTTEEASKESTTEKKEDGTSKKEETTSKKEETTEKKDDASKKEEEALLAQKAATKKTLIINAIIIAAIIAIIVAVAIKFRAKLSVFFRSVKSELGKIVWSSKENTRKSFLVVIVVALAIAAIIWVLDLTFNTGLGMLGKLFG